MKWLKHLIVAAAFLLCVSLPATAQFYFLDSSKAAFRTQKADTNKILNGMNISSSYVVLDPDSALFYAQECYALAQQVKLDRYIFWSDCLVAEAFSALGKYPLELAYCFKARAIARKMGTEEDIGAAKMLLSDYYYNLGEYQLSLRYLREIKDAIVEHCPHAILPIWMNLARIYEGMNRPDSAILYSGKSLAGLVGNPYQLLGWQIDRVRSQTAWMLGHSYNRLGRYDSAVYWYRQGLPVSTGNILKIDEAEERVGMATAYRATGRLDSALHYSRLVLDDSLSRTYPAGKLKALNVTAAIYESAHNNDSAVKYLRLASVIKDSLFNRDKMTAIQALTDEEQEREKQIEADNMRVSNRYGILILLAGFIAISLFALVMLRWQRLRQLQKMRNSIADDLHDDIGSTLSSISIMSELAKVKSPEAVPLLTTIEENAISLQENMSDIVWAVNPKNDRFENVFQRMNEFASGILEARHICFEFHSDPSLDATRLSMTQRKNLYLFFKESINNAAKYSGASRVSVAIGRKDNRVFMHIRDDGRGFDTATTVNGHGMLTLKKRREELGGELRIDSLPGKGTAVDLKFRIT